MDRSSASRPGPATVCHIASKGCQPAWGSSRRRRAQNLPVRGPAKRKLHHVLRGQPGPTRVAIDLGRRALENLIIVIVIIVVVLAIVAALVLPRMRQAGQ